jgi:anti-sigma regulatory factor (Ser/Thr protein kinase)
LLASLPGSSDSVSVKKRRRLAGVMRLTQGKVAAAQARRFARNFSAERGLADPLAADLELVVTELVTNAIRHGEPPIDVELDLADSVIRGEVFDGSTAPPAPNPNPDYRGGYGLNIVAKCTSRWGTEVLTSGHYRKQVWFEIETQGAANDR